MSAISEKDIEAMDENVVENPVKYKKSSNPFSEFYKEVFRQYLYRWDGRSFLN